MGRPLLARVNLGLGAAAALGTLGFGAALAASDPSPFRQDAALVAGGTVAALGLLQAAATLLLLARRRAGAPLQATAALLAALSLLWALWRSDAWLLAPLLAVPAALLALALHPAVRPPARA